MDTQSWKVKLFEIIFRELEISVSTQYFCTTMWYCDSLMWADKKEGKVLYRNLSLTNHKNIPNIYQILSLKLNDGTKWCQSGHCALINKCTIQKTIHEGTNHIF